MPVVAAGFGTTGWLMPRTVPMGSGVGRFIGAGIVPLKFWFAFHAAWAVLYGVWDVPLQNWGIPSVIGFGTVMGISN